MPQTTSSSSARHSSTSERPPAPAVATDLDALNPRSSGFSNETLKNALSRVTLPKRTGSDRSFMEIRLPTANIDPIFARSLDRAVKEYIKANGKDILKCNDPDPAELADKVRMWALKEGYADEIAAVSKRASRRATTEARQHIIAAFHFIMIHELLGGKEMKVDPDDDAGFFEAELYELEKDSGPIELVARHLVEEVARLNRRVLADAEKTLLAREMRNTL